MKEQVGYEILEIFSTDDVCGVNVEAKNILCGDCMHKVAVPFVVNSFTVDGNGFQCSSCRKVFRTDDNT